VTDRAAPGWRLVLDPATRRTDGGRTLIGGAPLRILRLSERGRRWLDRVAAGDALPDDGGSVALTRRLVDGGLAHPVPPAGAGPSPADVAVVIPVNGDAEGLARTVAGLGPVARLVVVDDGSPDAAAVRRAAGAGSGSGSGTTVLRHDVNLGPAAARETGWRATSEPFVAFVDADVETPPGWLDALLPHLADPAVGLVAPRVRSAGAGVPRWLAAYESVRSSLDRGPVPGPVRPGSRVPYVPTAAVVARRAALEAVGGFDQGMRVGEDVDLVWRLHGAGWRVRYEPAAVVRHPARPGLRAWARQRFTYGTSAAALAERHGSAVAPLGGLSGWSALAWGAVVAGHPVVGAAVGAGTTAALVPKLAVLDDPRREAIRIAGAGHLWAGRRVADALVRSWWPLTALLAVAHRRSRPAIAAALTIPALLDWREERPALDPLRYLALRIADDLAYGAGVWVGAARARSIAALLPSFSGPLPPPTAVQ
jgi:mycofactocin system glycosyltransferase